MSRPTLAVTCTLPPEVEAELEAAFAVRYVRDAFERPREALLEAVEGADAMLVLALKPVDAALIAALPASVRAIGTYSVGHEHIDLAAARAKGVAVLSTPDVLTGSVAETALLLLLGAARRATESIELIRSGNWRGWTPTQLVGVELSGKALGIFGMGRIGRGIARRARGFGMSIHYHNRTELTPELAEGAVFHGAAEAFLGSIDALVIASPHTPTTHHFLNADSIDWLRPGAIVVNIGRGPVIDDDALIGALRDGRVRAAGLDVFTGEPRFDPRYLDLPNVFMLPHIGSSTIDSRLAMGRVLIAGFTDLLEGREPGNRIA